MGDHTNIEWTDATWNPVGGCSIKSPGCAHCYAQRMAGTRLARHPLYAGTTSPSKAGPVFNGRLTVAPDDAPVWTWPLRWRGAKVPRRGAGARSLIFVGDMSDLFHADRPRQVIDRVFAVIALARQHDFQVLTKRADVMADYCNDPGTPRRVWDAADRLAFGRGMGNFHPDDAHRRDIPGDAWPLPNVWAGTSSERQPEADERLPHLLRCKAVVRFVSGEPLLGHVDAAWALSGNRLEIASGFLKRGHFSPGLETLRPIDWVIAGNESGPHRRPGDLENMRSLRDQCAAAGVPFFAKQDDKVKPLPDDLRSIRQFPRGSHA